MSENNNNDLDVTQNDGQVSQGVEKAKNTKVLERHLEITIEEKIYNELLEIC